MKVSRRLVLNLFIVLVISAFSMQAHANLELLGQGTSVHGSYNLIYDSDLDITWYDYSASRHYWDNQMAWADVLSVDFGSNVYNDWRLPVVFDNSCFGWNCTNSEMGHLHYTELGNTGGAGGFTKTGDFQNLLAISYWTGTEYAGREATNAWLFSFYDGNQYDLYKYGYQGYTIAVHAGRLTTPEPISSILFVTGGTLLAGRRYIKRKKKA